MAHIPLAVGLLNMMADGALRATERQFGRLLPGTASRPVRWSVFSLPQIQRPPEAARHIQENYQTFATVREQGLDALVITGVNLSDPRLEIQPFWDPLVQVMDWASQHVTSTLCSCLATHAVLQFRFGQVRQPLGGKLWGVYRQDVREPGHPLTRGLPGVVAVPHSRHNDVSAAQFEMSGLEALISGREAGVHLAATGDCRLVLMQGHPEYDTISLLKEYQREVRHYHTGARQDYPPVPDHYLAPGGWPIVERHTALVQSARDQGRALPVFPEAALTSHLTNAWAAPAARMFRNWLDQVDAMHP